MPHLTSPALAAQWLVCDADVMHDSYEVSGIGASIIAVPGVPVAGAVGLYELSFAGREQELMLADGVHPNAAGGMVWAETVLGWLCGL